MVVVPCSLITALVHPCHTGRFRRKGASIVVCDQVLVTKQKGADGGLYVSVSASFTASHSSVFVSLGGTQPTVLGLTTPPIHHTTVHNNAHAYSRYPDTIVAQAEVTLACISAEGGRMMAVPEKALASMNLDAGGK